MNLRSFTEKNQFTVQVTVLVTAKGQRNYTIYPIFIMGLKMDSFKKSELNIISYLKQMELEYKI